MIDAIWNFLASVEEWGVSVWVREGDFVTYPLSTFYMMLGFHSVGMAMVVGVNFMLSLRFFGYFRNFPMWMAPRLMTVAWWGFFINLTSGLFLLIGQPRREILTPTFDIKILLIVLAVITMLVMQRSLRGLEDAATAAGAVNPDGTMTAAAAELVPEQAKVAALLINFFWIGAIIAGRLIGYVQPPPP